MKAKYSGKEIIKAGECFLDENISQHKEKLNSAMDVLSYWRFQHETPLETALELMESEVRKKDKTAIFAKRLKRYISIVGKLKRFPTMKLKNMQDIGGCRAIISNQKKVYQIAYKKGDRFIFHTRKGTTRKGTDLFLVECPLLAE